MKNEKKTYFNKPALICILVATFIGLSTIFTSCYEPSPLYGTWVDNQGNKITFINDGTYNAFIYNDSNVKKSDSGNYSVIENTLTFSVEGGSSVVTEWDIRGSMLYITWAQPDTTNKSLTLYHTSK